MGLLTRLQMQTRVRERVLNRGTGSLSAANINSFLQDAYDHVSRPNIYVHRELQTEQTVTLTVVGGRVYALTDSVDVVTNVFNQTQSYAIHPTTVDRLDSSVIPTSRPSRFALWGDDIIFDALPDTNAVNDVILIRHFQTPTAFAADGTTTAIHERFDEIIIHGATYRSWSHLGNVERAREEMDQFAKILREAPDRVHMQGKIKGYTAYPRITPVQRMR